MRNELKEVIQLLKEKGYKKLKVAKMEGLEVVIEADEKCFYDIDLCHYQANDIDKHLLTEVKTLPEAILWNGLEYYGTETINLEETN